MMPPLLTLKQRLDELLHEKPFRLISISMPSVPAITEIPTYSNRTFVQDRNKMCFNIEDEVTKEILEIDIIDYKDVEHFEKVVNDIINRKKCYSKNF